MEDFFRQSLVHLRIQKGVSARDMSLTLGQSESRLKTGRHSCPCRYFSISASTSVSPERLF